LNTVTWFEIEGTTQFQCRLHCAKEKEAMENSGQAICEPKGIFKQNQNQMSSFAIAVFFQTYAHRSGTCFQY